ncbi:MAG: cation-transporting P-type ATPase, partial [Patescibacteria group bacterium]
MDDSRHLQYYRLSPEAILDELKTRKQGLSSSEAAVRADQYGHNALEITRKETPILTYLRQFRDLMIVLLLASSVVSFILGDARTAVVLLVLVIFNTTIGFLQEHKAGRVMESLEKLVVSNAAVLRNGKRIEIPARELTLGDIAYIEEGNAVPADLRVIEEDELSTNDFALTGESQPTRKFVH